MYGQSKIYPTDIEAGNSGFSLVEVLTVLMLLSMVGTIMSGFIGQLRQLDQRSSTVALKQNAQLVLRHMATTLSHSKRTPFEIDQRGRMTILKGDRQSVQFVSPARISSSRFALRHIEFKRDHKRDRILQSSLPILIADENRDGLRVSEPILRNVDQLSFAYLNFNGEWQEEWTESSRRPQAIKIAVVLAKEESRVSLTRIATIAAIPPFNN